jgi:hypothetical protein
MGEKVTGAFEFGYELVDEGPHIFSVETASGAKNEDIDKGWTFKIRTKVQGGESDGRSHFEQINTRFGGKVNKQGFKKLLGICFKVGLIPPKDYDSDQFESEEFAKKFQGIIGKNLGMDIFHQTSKQGKTFSNSRAIYTVQEAKDKMNTTVKGATTPDPKLGGVKKEEQSDSWE